jgi:hypothetical protein
VIIRHKTLGIMHKCFMLAIFLYVIVYTIIYQKARAKHKICGCPHVLAPGIGRGSRLARFISCVQKYNVSELPQGTVSLSILPAGDGNLVSPDATLNYVSNKPYCQQPPADAFNGSSRSTICSSLRRETVVASFLSPDSIVRAAVRNARLRSLASALETNMATATDLVNYVFSDAEKAQLKLCPPFRVVNQPACLNFSAATLTAQITSESVRRQNR